MSVIIELNQFFVVPSCCAVALTAEVYFGVTVSLVLKLTVKLLALNELKLASGRTIFCVKKICFQHNPAK